MVEDQIRRLVAGLDRNRHSCETRKSISKRRVNNEDLSSGEGGDEDEDRKRLKRSLGSQGQDGARKFACPFFKYDPGTHCKFGSCTGPGFTLVSRIKYAILIVSLLRRKSANIGLPREHLYRRHKPPIQCLRCWSEFENENDLENYSRAGDQCDLRAKPLTVIMSTRKLELIRSKRSYTSDPGEEGRWRDIYRILFPGAEIPCPCMPNCRATISACES